MSDVRPLASADTSTELLLVETAVMAAIPVLTLVDLLLHPGWGVWGILAATITFVVMQASHLTPGVRRTSLVLAVVTAVLLPAVPDPLPMLERGIRIGGLIASLLVAVNLLSRAVSRIPCIRDALGSLYRLPPGKRYFGLSVASQFFGGLLGLAGIAMMMEGAARQDAIDESQKISSFTAIARGYSALSLWSPLYSNMSIVLSLYQGAHWALVLPVALAVTALFILLGTVLDRFGKRPAADGPGTDGGALLRQSWPVMLGMSVFLGFMVLTSQGLGLPISTVIIAAAPVAAWMVNAWLLRTSRNALCAGARQVTSDMFSFRAMTSEVLMFLASGCAGTVIGSAIPTAWTAALGQLVAGSPALACFTISGAIVLMSATAIHPMLSAVIVGTSLTLDLLGIPLLVHLTAVLVGWGLAIIVTPFSVLSLMASRWSGIPVLVISLRANAWFVLLALITSAALLGVMARMIAH
jgi:hypothetical protein